MCVNPKFGPVYVEVHVVIMSFEIELIREAVNMLFWDMYPILIRKTSADFELGVSKSLTGNEILSKNVG